MIAAMSSPASRLLMSLAPMLSSIRVADQVPIL